MFKSFIFIRNRDKMMSMKFQLEKLMAANSSSKAIVKYARNSLRFTTAYYILYGIHALTLMLPVLVIFLFTGEMRTVLPTRLPWVNWKTPRGYIILTIYHLISNTLGLSIYPLSDTIVTIFTYNAMMYSNVLADKVDQLNVHLVSDQQRKNLTEIKIQFRNLLVSHIEMAG